MVLTKTVIGCLLISTLLLLNCDAKLSVMDSNGILHEFELVPVKFFNTTRNEFYVTPFHVNSSMSTEDGDYRDKLVLKLYQPGIDDEAVVYQEGGAVGMIMGTRASSFIGGARYRLSQPRREVSLVTVAVSNEDYVVLLEMLENGDVQWVVMEGDNDIPNPYEKLVLNTGVITHVVLGLFFAGILGICVYLLIFEILGEWNHFQRLRILLLVALIVSNGYRFFFCIYDPFSYQGLSPWPVSSFLHLFNIPLMLLTELIVSLLWFKTLRITIMHNNSFLVVMKLPFYIIVSIISILLILTVILTAIDPRSLDDIAKLLAVFYFSSLIILAVYHLVIAIIFFRAVDKIKKKASKKRNNKSFIVKVILMSVTDILVVILILMILSPASYEMATLVPVFLISMSGIHSCVVLTLFSWKASDASKSTHTTGESLKTAAE